MIIFGTRGVTYNYANGDFFCPGCSNERAFRHKRVRRFFTLYFIPCIPLDMLGEYVECAGCGNTYDKAVLQFDPRAENAAFEAEFQVAMRRVMVLMMLADGVIDDEELETIVAIYGKIAGAAITEDQIRDEAAELQGRDVSDYVSSVRGNLNDRGKELVVQAAYAVAAADGDFADEERLLLLQIGEALEMTDAHLRGVMAAATDA